MANPARQALGFLYHARKRLTGYSANVKIKINANDNRFPFLVIIKEEGEIWSGASQRF